MFMRVAILPLIVSLVLFTTLISTSAQAQVNELYISPVSSSVGQGSQVDLDVRAKAPVGADDIHSIQFDIVYDDSILDFVSVGEGTMLNNSGADPTYFGYISAGSGLIDDIYIARNDTTGVQTADGLIATVSFTASGSGTADVGLNEIIWVTSAVGNESAGTANPTVTNGTVTSSTVSPPAINSRWCEIGGNWYQDCGGITYGDVITK
ncbi:MAG: cohesin domain-containing protein, partial [Candidatus Aenigmatarchaeota archaeon]